MRRLRSLAFFVCCAALLPGCGGGIEPGMGTPKPDAKPLDPGGDAQPNMSGASTAPAPAAKK